MAERDSCAWCGADLPSPAAVGRPRAYCSRSCRQRAYEHRHGEVAVDAARETGEQVVVIRQAQLDDLRDRLFALRCAVADVDTALAEHATHAELERVCRELVHSAGELNRLWVGSAEQRAS